MRVTNLDNSRQSKHFCLCRQCSCKHKCSAETGWSLIYRACPLVVVWVDGWCVFIWLDLDTNLIGQVVGKHLSTLQDIPPVEFATIAIAEAELMADTPQQVLGSRELLNKQIINGPCPQMFALEISRYPTKRRLTDPRAG